MKVIIVNKKANYEYFILEKYEAGLVLQGSEIKSIRNGQVQINDAYVTFKGNEAYITNMHIAKYDKSSIFNHEETRSRKLLLKRREITQLEQKKSEEGLTIIPIRLYLKNSLAKLEVALVRGKKNYDKRQTLKEQDQEKRLRKSNVRGR